MTDKRDEIQNRLDAYDQANRRVIEQEHWTSREVRPYDDMTEHAPSDLRWLLAENADLLVEVSRLQAELAARA